MATYKVISLGFINGVLYSPEHPTRNKVVVDEPFVKEPSWLKIIDAKVLSAAQKAAATKARNKAEADKATAVLQDKKEIAGASFLSTVNPVETL